MCDAMIEYNYPAFEQPEPDQGQIINGEEDSILLSRSWKQLLKYSQTSIIWTCWD